MLGGWGVGKQAGGRYLAGMRWLLLDGALVLVALLVVAALAVRVWRQLSALGREVAATGERVTNAVSRLQSAIEPGDRSR